MMDFKKEASYWLQIKNDYPRRFTQIIKKQHNEFYVYINDNYNGTTFSERLYNYINPIAKTCDHCGDSNLRWLDFNRGYAQFCSTKCLSRSNHRKELTKQTCLARYGVDHYSKTDRYKKQFKSSCQRKYGVDNPGQISELKEKRARAKQRTFFNNLLDDIDGISLPLFDFSQYNEVREVKPWSCIKCDNIFDSHVFNKLPKCPTCYPTAQYGGQSNIEKEILCYIRSLYAGEIINNTRDIISPKELDIYLPEKHLAIEVCGVYWHSDRRQPDKFYHQKKQQQCEKLGIKLLTILDYEWNNKRSICEAIIRHNLGSTSRNLNARECEIRPVLVKDARVFCDSHHIRGFNRASEHHGLYYGDELVSYMSISKDRFSKSDKYEIIRFCSSCNVRGGFSKLTSYVKKRYNTIIKSYVDLRWGDGHSYEKMNYRIVGETTPCHWYFVNNIMYHRLAFTKKVLVEQGNDSSKTAFEIMDDNGALRFWDCGVKVYEI